MKATAVRPHFALLIFPVLKTRNNIEILLMAACGQFRKPDKVLVILEEREITHDLRNLINDYKEHFPDKLFLVTSAAAARQILTRDEKINLRRRTLGLWVSLLLDDEVLYPNYFEDAEKFISQIRTGQERLFYFRWNIVCERALASEDDRPIQFGWGYYPQDAQKSPSGDPALNAIPTAAIPLPWHHINQSSVLAELCNGQKDGLRKVMAGKALDPTQRLALQVNIGHRSKEAVRATIRLSLTEKILAFAMIFHVPGFILRGLQGFITRHLHWKKMLKRLIK